MPKTITLTLLKTPVQTILFTLHLTIIPTLTTTVPKPSPDNRNSAGLKINNHLKTCQLRFLTAKKMLNSN